MSTYLLSFATWGVSVPLARVDLIDEMRMVISAGIHYRCLVQWKRKIEITASIRRFEMRSTRHANFFYNPQSHVNLLTPFLQMGGHNGSANEQSS